MPTLLPAEFADLEPFADWSLQLRGASATPSACRASMDELQAFYDAAFPRLDDITAYLDGLDSTPSPRTPPACSGCATRW